jgi:hypothetical protein
MGGGRFPISEEYANQKAREIIELWQIRREEKKNINVTHLCKLVGIAESVVRNKSNIFWQTELKRIGQINKKESVKRINKTKRIY